MQQCMHKASVDSFPSKRLHHDRHDPPHLAWGHLPPREDALALVSVTSGPSISSESAVMETAAPSFARAFVGFVFSVSLMTSLMVVLGV